MKIKVVCVGNLKDKFFIDASNEYIKRLSKYCELKVCELVERNDKTTIAETLKLEAKDIEKELDGEIVVLDVASNQKTSENFAEIIEKNKNFGGGRITFVVGSSNGLDESIKKRANLCLSFSKMTFPHRLFRVMLLEQIYRAFCIINKTPYHK